MSAKTLLTASLSLEILLIYYIKILIPKDIYRSLDAYINKKKIRPEKCKKHGNLLYPSSIFKLSNKTSKILSRSKLYEYLFFF